MKRFWNNVDVSSDDEVSFQESLSRVPVCKYGSELNFERDLDLSGITNKSASSTVPGGAYSHQALTVSVPEVFWLGILSRSDVKDILILNVSSQSSHFMNPIISTPCNPAEQHGEVESLMMVNQETEIPASPCSEGWWEEIVPRRRKIPFFSSACEGWNKSRLEEYVLKR